MCLHPCPLSTRAGGVPSRCCACDWELDQKRNVNGLVLMVVVVLVVVVLVLVLVVE